MQRVAGSQLGYCDCKRRYALLCPGNGALLPHTPDVAMGKASKAVTCIFRYAT